MRKTKTFSIISTTIKEYVQTTLLILKPKKVKAHHQEKYYIKNFYANFDY